MKKKIIQKTVGTCDRWCDIQGKAKVNKGEEAMHE
jgi:hypothetical protein